jgi:3-hydroxyisobutyrate dehydrogenase-like beta-hydroxyacid dehydrogenase
MELGMTGHGRMGADMSERLVRADFASQLTQRRSRFRRSPAGHRARRILSAPRGWPR